MILSDLSIKRPVFATVLMLAVPSAVLIRGNGVALAPAIATALFLSRGSGRRQVRQCLAASLVVLLITFSGWMIWGKFHQFSGINNVTYLDEVQASDVNALWKAGAYGEGVARISPIGLLRRIYQNVARRDSTRLRTASRCFGGQARIGAISV